MDIYLGTVALEKNRWAPGRIPTISVSDYLTSAKKDGLRVKDEDMQYPSSIIACYSGEDLRVQLIKQRRLVKNQISAL